MAPQNKTTSSSGFIYELNNFTALFEHTVDAPHEFHNLMRFLGQCKLVYAITEAHVLLCEVIEEVWIQQQFTTTLTRYSLIDLKGNSYSINVDILSTCLNLPADTHIAFPTENEISTMLGEINYAEPEANLGKIVRKNLRNRVELFL